MRGGETGPVGACARESGKLGTYPTSPRDRSTGHWNSELLRQWRVKRSATEGFETSRPVNLGNVSAPTPRRDRRGTSLQRRAAAASTAQLDR